MAAHTQSGSVEGYTIDNLLAIAFGSFKKLEWEARFAGEVRIVGYTKKNGKDEKEIIVEVSDTEVSVTSQLPTDDGWNLTSKNKIKTAQFLEAFNEVKSSATQHQLEVWTDEIAKLRVYTDGVLEKEAKQEEEIDKIMHLSTGSRLVTYTLISVNILVFILMAISGVGIFEPDSQDLVRWGADYAPATFGGEWWRLITCTFIHIGAIHLLFNMYALYMIGNYLEPMLGKLKYITAYICTGVFSSLVSLWWHKEPIVSAGASGAIFGLYGVFLALLTTNIIPKEMRKSLLQSIGVFIFYNLAYGMKSGVDNAAHVGGLLSGFVFGYIYFPVLKTPEQKKTYWAVSLILILCIVSASSFIGAKKDDSMAYRKTLERFSVLEEKALKALYDTTYVDGAAQLLAIQKDVLPAWNENRTILKETESYKLDDKLGRQRKFIIEYADLRQEEAQLFVSILSGNSHLQERLKTVQEEIDAKLKELKAALQ